MSIAITIQKRGSGKTTKSINLPVILCDKENMLPVDLDPQDVGLLSGVQTQYLIEPDAYFRYNQLKLTMNENDI